MAGETTLIAEQGVATLPDERWEQARRRADIIRPLAQRGTVSHEAAVMRPGLWTCRGGRFAF